MIENDISGNNTLKTLSKLKYYTQWLMEEGIIDEDDDLVTLDTFNLEFSNVSLPEDEIENIEDDLPEDEIENIEDDLPEDEIENIEDDLPEDEIENIEDDLKDPITRNIIKSIRIKS